jgi:hypothetical protein
MKKFKTTGVMMMRKSSMVNPQGGDDKPLVSLTVKPDAATQGRKFTVSVDSGRNKGETIKMASISSQYAYYNIGK